MMSLGEVPWTVGLIVVWWLATRDPVGDHERRKLEDRERARNAWLDTAAGRAWVAREEAKSKKNDEEHAAWKADFDNRMKDKQ
jgi:hypothetical protein